MQRPNFLNINMWLPTGRYWVTHSRVPRKRQEIDFSGGREMSSAKSKVIAGDAHIALISEYEMPPFKINVLGF